MKETYYLNQTQLPCIPNPHDCVIKEIQLVDNDLVFIFEDDISQHNSIIYTKSDAKSLIIRYHLMFDSSDISLYIRKNNYGILSRILHKPGVYQEIDLQKSNKQLFDLPKRGLEYVSHTVGMCSMVIELAGANSIVLKLDTDYVEYEWISQ